MNNEVNKIVHDKNQNITIKGTKDGLTLFINDSCSFEEAFQELTEKINVNELAKDERKATIKVKLGNRYLHKEQEDRLKQLINKKNRFTVQSIESDVLRKEEALKWKEESETKVVHKIVRSGQVVQIQGDLLLIGDVNPGGLVIASGNIYIMGKLLGIAHAGIDGDEEAVIVASYMKPAQLRIADYVSRAPDYESDGVYMECGFIQKEQNKIIIDRLQVLSHRRHNLSKFERRFLNG